MTKQGVDSNIQRAHDLVRELFENAKKPQRIISPKEDSTLFLAVKSFRTQRAMIVIAKEGLGQDVTILLRSIYESMITLHYLLEKDDPKQFERFFAFSAIVSEKRYDDAVKTFPTSPYVLRMKETEETIRKNAAFVRRHYFAGKSPKRWGLTLRDMAKAINLEDNHLLTYGYLCDMAHPEVQGYYQYLPHNQPHVSPRIGEPDFETTNGALGAAAGYLREILTDFNNVFNCGIKSANLEQVSDLLKATAAPSRKNLA